MLKEKIIEGRAQLLLDEWRVITSPVVGGEFVRSWRNTIEEAIEHGSAEDWEEDEGWGIYVVEETPSVVLLDIDVPGFDPGTLFVEKKTLTPLYPRWRWDTKEVHFNGAEVHYYGLQLVGGSSFYDKWNDLLVPAYMLKSGAQYEVGPDPEYDAVRGTQISTAEVLSVVHGAEFSIAVVEVVIDYNPYDNWDYSMDHDIKEKIVLVVGPSDETADEIEDAAMQLIFDSLG